MNQIVWNLKLLHWHTLTIPYGLLNLCCFRQLWSKSMITFSSSFIIIVVVVVTIDDALMPLTMPCVLYIVTNVTLIDLVRFWSAKQFFQSWVFSCQKWRSFFRPISRSTVQQNRLNRQIHTSQSKWVDIVVSNSIINGTKLMSFAFFHRLTKMYSD